MLDFLGRTHLLILHLPIGILLLSVALEWAHLFTKIKISKSIYQLIYLIGALAAIGACLTGNLLAGGYEYTDAETSNHFWAGIVTASLATLAFISNFTKLITYRKWLAIGIAISITITGHLGGSLTHGEGFLNPTLLAEQKEKPLHFEVENIEDAAVYADIIAPLLENKCISCHGPNKIKGKLRMDTPENLMANGKSGNDLLSAKGEMVKRIGLPESNDKHMPPDTKSQLSEEQIKVIEWWIANGASFDAQVTQMQDHEIMMPVLTRMIAESSEPLDDRRNIPALLPDVEVPAPSVEAINALKALDIVVLPTGEGSHFIDINFVNVDSVSEEFAMHLRTLNSNVVRLKLSDLSNASILIDAISSMENLQLLYLDGSDITDNDLSQLVGLEYLSFLNLSNTSVSNEGISQLSSLPQLKTLYTFGTSVTIDSLTSGLKTSAGGFELPVLETDTLRIPE